MFNEEYLSDLFERLAIPNTYFKNKTYEYQYWFRSLLQKIDSSLIFKGLPDDWPEDFFKIILWARGYLAVFKTERWGVTFQPVASLSGYDFYYQPQIVSIANPYYNKQLKLHKDVELIKLTPDFRGILDIIDYYATKLAELSKGLDMALINAKMPMVLIANNKAESETLKAVYDQVQQGESLVVWKEQLSDGEIIPRKEPFQMWNQDFKQTYIGTELLENLQQILDSFYMEIGLPTILNDKKAHTLNAEAGFQSAQSQARLACWVSNLNESFERIEKLFGLRLEVGHAQNDFETDGDDTAQERAGSGYKLGIKQ